MKKYIFLYALVMFVLCACENRQKHWFDNDDDDSGKSKMEQKFAAVNINDSTHYADILIACYDGSYILFDVNKDDKCGVLFINSSFMNELDEGVTIYIDSTGLPLMAQMRKGDMLFKNMTDSTCDMAFRDSLGNISYYWGINLWGEETDETNGVAPNKMPASLISEFTYPYIAWRNSVSNFDWTWDDAQRKAIVPFIGKIVSFAVTATLVVDGTQADRLGAVATLFGEASKSELISPNMLAYCNAIQDFLNYIGLKELWDLWKTGDEVKLEFAANKWSLSYVAQILNNYADFWLNNLTVFEEQTDDVFSHPEYQLQLSTYVLECGPEEKDYIVTVQTMSYWIIDEVQCDWCRASKEDNFLRIHVSKYEGIEDRACSVTIRTVAEQIPTATMTVKQSGVMFEVYPTELTFTGKNSSRGFYISANENVLEWHVTSMPNWLTKEEAENSVILSVVPSLYDQTTVQTGVVTIEATLVDVATPITRTIAIMWVPENNWNNTKWYFKGTIYNETWKRNENFELTIAIEDVADQTCDLSLFDDPDYENVIYLDESNRLQVMFWFPAADANGKLTTAYEVLLLTQTSETTATCEYISSTPFVYIGTVNGTRIE